MYGPTSIGAPVARSTTSSGSSRRPWRWTLSRSHSPSAASSPAADELVEVAEVAPSRLPELTGDHVAERVGGEVAERGRRPMHVLEHAVGVVGDLDPEVLARQDRPRFGQVGDLEPALEELELELEADEHVEVVGQLVGLDADQRRPHPVGGAVQLGGVGGVEPARKGRAQARQQALEIGAAAADPVLPQPALGLVQTQRARAPERAAGELGVDPGVIEPVAGLVQGAEQRGREVVARRSASSGARRGARSRSRTGAPSGRGATSPARAGAPPPASRPARAAPGSGNEPRRHESSTASGRAVTAATSGASPARSSPSKPRMSLARHSGLVLVEQRVVGMLEALESFVALGKAAPQLDVSLQLRPQELEVGLRARLAPRGLAERRRAGEIGAQLDRDPARLLPVASDDADQRPRLGVRGEPLDLGPAPPRSGFRSHRRRTAGGAPPRAWRAARRAPRRRRPASSCARPTPAARRRGRGRRSRRGARAARSGRSTCARDPRPSGGRFSAMDASRARRPAALARRGRRRRPRRRAMAPRSPSCTGPATTTGRCRRASSRPGSAGATPPCARCARRPGCDARSARSWRRRATATARGRPKLVRYWLMRPLDGDFEPSDEVDRLRWLGPGGGRAAARLRPRSRARLPGSARNWARTPRGAPSEQPSRRGRRLSRAADAGPIHALGLPATCIGLCVGLMHDPLTEHPSARPKRGGPPVASLHSPALFSGPAFDPASDRPRAARSAASSSRRRLSPPTMISAAPAKAMKIP